MHDCSPTYLVAYDQGQPVACATLWLVGNEPLPVQSRLLRRGLTAVLQRRPLLICRSPFGGVSGLFLPEDDRQETLRNHLAEAALDVQREQHASFLLFDFMSSQEVKDWPETFIPLTVSSPGTHLDVSWESFDEYLAANKKVRRHYQYIQNKARDLNVTVGTSPRVERMAEAMPLVRRIEQKFDSAFNPWIEGMMTNLDQVGGTWVYATIEGQLVGCNIILEDCGAQVNTGLGTVDQPFIYLILMYENLKVAFAHHNHTLRWGSGSYDFKEKLGFEKEDNNKLLFAASSKTLFAFGRWIGKYF